MSAKILLTSFQTWLPHQKSNSSGDLLKLIATINFPNVDLAFLRQLPVSTPEASYQTIKQIKYLQPDFVICCGMAESRTLLTIESNATWRQQKIKTSIDLSNLVQGLSFTQISHDAGKFVCEGLYYRILSYLYKHLPANPCIFVHVPILRENNLSLVLADFSLILQKISQ